MEKDLSYIAKISEIVVAGKFYASFEERVNSIMKAFES